MTRTRLALAFLGTLVATVLVVALLISIFERQQEARVTYLRLGEIQQGEPDPAVWGRSFPGHYNAMQQTLRTSELATYSRYGRYGGSEAFSRLQEYPNLTRLFAGYPFSVEYNEERGHSNALADMLSTKRLGDAKPGACMTCKSSQVPQMMSALGVDKFYSTPVKDLMAQFNPQHSIACADCHNAETMALQISRPAFKEAMERRGIDLSKATRQEMRTYVCAQCHVEYYFQGAGKYLTFPWDNGLRLENIEAYYEKANFKDWDHAETKAALVKMQHPEFELSSTGIHARAGVACADCHMPYRREAAVKVTDHWIRSPLVNLTNACSTCHRASEQEMAGRVLEIQDRTHSLLDRAETAILAAQDAIRSAAEKGATPESLQEARALHRKAFMRWDFISAENSMGFHSPQESARILGDAIDYARQAEIAVLQAASRQGR